MGIKRRRNSSAIQHDSWEYVIKNSENEQTFITMPLLVGLNRIKKMSKSFRNYIAFNGTTKDMFGKIMSISNETCLYTTSFFLESLIMK